MLPYFGFLGLLVLCSIRALPASAISSSGASANALAYQGRILRADGTPLRHSNVGFIFQITDPSSQCVIYQEQVNGINMTNSNGIFDVTIGMGTINWPSGSPNVLSVFNNASTLSCGTCSGYNCSANSRTYTPLSTDGRVLRVSFFDGAEWRNINPDTVIRSVPFAGFAQSASKLGTHTASDFILKNSINDSGSGSASCNGGSFLTWDAITKTFGCSSANGSAGGTVTSVSSANSYLSVVNGSVTPVLSVNVGQIANTVAAGDDSRIINALQTGAPAGGDLAGTYPNPSLAAIITAGTGTKITYDTKGRVTSSTSLGASDIPALDWSKITSGKPTSLSGYGITDALSNSGFTAFSAITANGSGSLTAVPGATSGSILNWTVTGPSWTSASYPSSTFANQLLYSSANNIVGGLATANNSVLMTNGSGVPGFSSASGDLFPQYTLLAGRAGGQTLYGGTAANNGLTIESTSNATKGSIILNPAGGNVGIGTTTPSQPLSVNSSVDGPIAHLQSSAPLGNWNYLQVNQGSYKSTFGIDPIGNAHVFAGPGQGLSLWTDGSQKAIITSAGNVGIGTSAPAAKLDVAGEVKFGNTSSTCNSTNEGQQRYNSTSKNMEFCNGTSWTAYGTGGSSGRTSCPSGFSLVGTSGSAEAYCISTNEETSTTWLSAVVTCSNKNPTARLCSAGEWIHACVKAGTYGISGMTDSNREWVADIDDAAGGTLGYSSNCDSLDRSPVSLSLGSRCCFR